MHGALVLLGRCVPGSSALVTHKPSLTDAPPTLRLFKLYHQLFAWLLAVHAATYPHKRGGFRIRVACVSTVACAQCSFFRPGPAVARYEPYRLPGMQPLATSPLLLPVSAAPSPQQTLLKSLWGRRRRGGRDTGEPAALPSQSLQLEVCMLLVEAVLLLEQRPRSLATRNAAGRRCNVRSRRCSAAPCPTACHTWSFKGAERLTHRSNPRQVVARIARVATSGSHRSAGALSPKLPYVTYAAAVVVLGHVDQ